MVTIGEHEVQQKVYHIEYDGYYTMNRHDGESNSLKRWFDNYKLDKDGRFANNYEWCIVKEVPSTARRGKSTRYICEIGEDTIKSGIAEHRKYVIDHTAPEPPLIFFAAKIKYIPPPEPSLEDIRREAEYRRMYERSAPLRSYYEQNPTPDLMINMDGSIAGSNPEHIADALRMALMANGPSFSRVHVYPTSELDILLDYKSPKESSSSSSSSSPPPKHRRNV